MASVLSASKPRLLRASASPEAAAAILEFRATMLHALRTQMVARPLLTNWRALLDYLHADMAESKVERFRVLHLDSRNHLIKDEVAAEGSIDQAAVHVREIVRRAIDLGSVSLILVHNHPSGEPTPSRADVETTKAISDATKPLGIEVHDHLIIARDGHASLRALGFLN